MRWHQHTKATVAPPLFMCSRLQIYPFCHGKHGVSKWNFPLPSPGGKAGFAGHCAEPVGWESAEIIPGLSHLSTKQHGGSRICGELAVERVINPQGFCGSILKDRWGKLRCAPSEIKPFLAVFL